VNRMNIHRRARHFLLALATFFLIALVTISPARAATAAPDAPHAFSELERAVNAAFSSGDYVALYDAIERLLTAFPDRFESFLYYYDLARLADVHGPARVAATLEKLIAAVERGGGPHRNIARLTLMVELERALYQFDRTRAAAVSARLSPVRTWTLIGPYYRFGDADLRHPFPPELSIKLSDASVHRKIVRVDAASGAVDLSRYLYPDDGVAYAATTIVAPGPVKVRVYAEGPYTLFVNGREAVRNHPSGTSRNLRVLRVEGPRRISLLLKVMKKGDWRFRVLVTDANDAIVPTTARPDETSTDEAACIEEPDVPFPALVERLRSDTAESHFALGTYYDELNSRESIAHYRAAIARRPDPVYRFTLAAALIAYGENAASALASEGWTLYESLNREHPDFAPARFRRFQRERERRDYRGAFRTGRDLIADAPRYLPARVAHARFLSELGYDTEFDDALRSFRLAFPSSPAPHRLFASHVRAKNPRAAEDALRVALAARNDRSDLTALVRLYKNRGAHQEIVSLLRSRDPEGELIAELIDAYIAKGDEPGARAAIIDALSRREDPYLLLKLGELYYRRGADPSAHWDKMLALKPSLFTMTELMSYLARQRIESPFARNGIGGAEDAILRGVSADTESRPSRILYRGRFFHLMADGGSRVLCEDVYLVKDRKQLERWGEYEIAFAGTLHPVRARVYHADGSFSDSHRIEKINGTNYLNLSSLSIGSVVHIAYVVDFPVTEPRNSSFFSIPLTALSGFDEPVDRCDISVTSPAGQEITLVCNREGVRERTAVAGGVRHAITLTDLPAVRREYDSGPGIGRLPHYAFSSMRDASDFVTWYGGIIANAERIDPAAARRFAAPTLRETVDRVYEFTAREMDTLRNVLYHPEPAENTLMRMRGTPEDKAVLAKSLLAGLGIRSFIAVARDAHLPPTGAFMSPDAFTHALLYVPLDGRESLWLDFTGRHAPCGAVPEELAGVEALVLLKNGFEHRTVRDTTPGGIAGRYRITISDAGDAAIDAEVAYEGRTGSMRRDFMNATYREDRVNAVLGGMFPSMSIDEFRLSNLREYSRPFVIAARGRCDSFATVGHDRIILQPMSQSSRVLDYLHYERRETPLVIRHAISEDDAYEFTLPDRFADAVVEREVRLTARHGHARIDIKKAKGSRTLRVVKSVRFSRARIEPGEYQDFVKFCVALKTAERHSIIIRR